MSFIKSIKGLSFLLLTTTSLLQSAAADLKDLEEDFSAMDISESDDLVLARYPGLRRILTNGGDLNSRHPGVYDSPSNYADENTIGDVYLLAAFVFDDLPFARFLVRRGAVISGPPSRKMRVHFGERKNSVQEFLQVCDDLCAAAYAKEYDQVQDALARGAYINARDWGHGTPLSGAMTSVEATDANHVAVAKLLLSIPGVDVNAQAGGCNNRPFFAAVVMRSLELVQLFLERPEVDVDCRRSSGDTALDFAQWDLVHYHREEARPIVECIEDFKNNRVLREAFLQWSPRCFFYDAGVVLIVADYMSTSNPRQA